MNEVVNACNRNKKQFKSELLLLKHFFTNQTASVILPQHTENMYRYKLGDKVRVYLTKAERVAIGFKWSLTPGVFIMYLRLLFPPPPFPGPVSNFKPVLV